MGKVNLQRGRKEYGVREEGKEGWKEGSKKKKTKRRQKNGDVDSLFRRLMRILIEMFSVLLRATCSSP